MADIDFGDTHGEQLATVIRVVRDLHRDFYGNGDPGIKRKAEQFMSEAKGARDEQERQHKSNSMKLNIIIAICALLTVVLTACGIIVTVEVSARKGLDPAKIFHSQSVQPAYAKEQKPPQEATDDIYKVR